MLIDNKKEDLVYKLIAEKLKFKLSCSYRGHSLNVNLPFEIEGNYAVYAIDTMSDSQIDSMQEIVRMKITIISGVMLRKGAVKFWRINC